MAGNGRFTRLGDATSISGHPGNKNDTIPKAITAFAKAYVDQKEQDYQALVNAVKPGKVTTEIGI